MRASKENAGKARAYLEPLARLVDAYQPKASNYEALHHLRKFIEAAEKKLPREAAFIRDGQRAAS